MLGCEHLGQIISFQLDHQLEVVRLQPKAVDEPTDLIVGQQKQHFANHVKCSCLFELVVRAAESFHRAD